jgi:nucleoside-diphosphate-sugar epimerase
VLVTGVAGFLGANVSRAFLEAGAEVHGIVRSRPASPAPSEIPPELAVHVGDLRQAGAVTRVIAAAHPTVVVHLAAGSGHPTDAGERARMLEDTVLGTANLLEALRPSGVERVVHVGGGLEYGRGDRPARESDALDPVTFRGAAKGASTLLALEFGHATGVPVTVLRPFAVYGPWERPPRFVPTVVTAALEGDPIRLTHPGRGRDFVFAGDVAHACLLAATEPAAAGSVVNVGTGRLTTNEALVDRLAAVTGIELDVRVGEQEARTWDSGAWVADTHKARNLLGWEAEHDLDAGLAETVAWFAGREVGARAPAGVDA